MTESKKPAPAAADANGGAMSPYRESPSDITLPEPPKYLTPQAWAEELGHVDPVVRPGGRANAEECRGWIFAAAKVHAGWGTRLADDVLLSKDQYEKAVDAAMNRPLSETRTERLLARIDAQKPKEKV